jgi:hypothetical protein
MPNISDSELAAARKIGEQIDAMEFPQRVKDAADTIRRLVMDTLRINVVQIGMNHDLQNGDELLAAEKLAMFAMLSALEAME